MIKILDNLDYWTIFNITTNLVWMIYFTILGFKCYDSFFSQIDNIWGKFTFTILIVYLIIFIDSYYIWDIIHHLKHLQIIKT